MEKTIKPEIINPYIVPLTDIVYKYREDAYHCEIRKLKMHILRPYYAKMYGDMSFLPKLPVILNIGGGAWRHSTPFFHLPELTYFANNGYLVASIGYTVSSDGAFPDQIEDVKSAIRFIRKNAAMFGADPDKIALIGDSAGGHLAALAGVTGGKGLFLNGDDLEISDIVSAVVSYYGPFDLTDKDFSPLSNDTLFFDFLRNNAGHTSKEEILKKAEMASPIRYVDGKCPPFLILHGTGDLFINPNQAKKMYEKLTECGVDADLIWLDGSEHQDLAFVQESTLKEVLLFLDRYLKR